jgi:site-specific recombinase XerD
VNEIIQNASSQKTTYFLASMIPSFIAQADVAPTSRQTYRRCLQRFFEWALEEHGNESYLKREHIVSYKNFLDYSGLRPFTRAAYLVAVRRFFEWTESALLYPNIAKSIKGIRRSSRSHHKDSLQPSAISQLLHSFAPDTLTNKRDYALIFLLLHTGLRLIEVSRALISDIEVRSDQALLWIRGKGCEGKDSFVVIHAEAFSYILSFSIFHGDSACLLSFTDLATLIDATQKTVSAKIICA